jgi:hypothetical protein
MASGTSRADVKAVFAGLAKAQLDGEVEEKIYEIALMFGINAHDLANKWESYALNKHVSIKPTLDSLKPFQQGATATAASASRA